MSAPREIPGPPGGEDERAKETLLGLLDVVTYHDEESLYSVLRVLPETGYDVPGEARPLFGATRVTAVGRVVDPIEGTRVRLLGTWGRHPSHGTQFEFELLDPLPPIDSEGIERYLASKTFEGIGKALAKRIVRALGTNALERIIEEPGVLAEVSGIRAHVADALRAKLLAQAEVHRTLAFLHGLGLGPLQARAVLTKFKDECEAVVRSNPYRLTQITGMGFVLADRVARKLGVAAGDPCRLRAALRHELTVAADDGHSFQPLGDLVRRAHGLLRGAIDPSAFVDALAGLEEDEEFVLDRRLCAPDTGPWDASVLAYLPWLHTSEVGLAENLTRLMRAGAVEPLATAEQLAVAERAVGLDLHPDQKDAVLRLLSHPVVLLTGGPGVGKTTIVRFVASLAEAAGARVKLASPTGRAAKRLSEATERPAATVHRLLGYSPGEGGFEHDRARPLRAGVVIVDEISMLDVILAYHLSKAIASPTRLVLVGDPDQLPSVGAGSVLADLLECGELPVARLSQIYRQGARSLIVENAHRILAGDMPILPERGDRSRDFYLFPSDDAAGTAKLVVDVVTRRIPATFGFDWTTDVQVIAPMYRGDCGVDVLNERLREAQGYGGREVEIGQQLWRVGDRVIHTRNDYEKEVFNGDMGRIVTVSAEGIVTVRYPEQDVVYTGAELSDLRPAFAITVHRSQGGEFPVVVLPLVTQHAVMLQRNLLYTAVTRAKKLVVLVGSRRALAMAVENDRQARRMSALAERLRRMLADPDAAHDRATDDATDDDAE